MTQAIKLIDEMLAQVNNNKGQADNEPSSNDVNESKQSDSNITELIIRKPDDFHLHVRDGDSLSLTVPHATRQYYRAIIMPNLVPPVKNVQDAQAYRARILQHCPKSDTFIPLMTLYLTDKTTSQDIIDASKSGIIYGVKLYPKGATTNSDNGVTDIFSLTAVLNTMADCNIPLLIHGEVTDQSTDVFNRESLFLDTILPKLVKTVPKLSIVLEHITTRKAVSVIETYHQNGKENIAATITCHHLLSNRSEIFNKGINPHLYCLPIIKTEEDRLSLIQAATSGKRWYFAGSDSAPHERNMKEKCCGKAGIYTGYNSLALYAMVFDMCGKLDRLEDFVAKYGAQFYGIKVNEECKIKLVKRKEKVPECFDYLKTGLVPYKAGEEVSWTVVPYNEKK